MIDVFFFMIIIIYLPQFTNLKLKFMKKLTLIFSLLVLSSITMLFAQTVQITGTVTDQEDGIPIPGVTVVAVGTTIGATTDVDGNYSISVPSNVNMLEFSFIGMRTVEVPIDGRTEIDVVMAADIFGLDEVIVTGVASRTPRKKLSISVEQVGEDQLKEVPAISAATALQGKVSGLKIVQASGRPGSAASIRLRGATTIGGSRPLLLSLMVLCLRVLSLISMLTILRIWRL